MDSIRGEPKWRPSGFERRSLAPEKNLWAGEELVERAVLYRGAIVSGFGQIETGIAEIALRASCHPAYRELRDRPPYGATKTAKYLKEVFAAPGPVQTQSSVAILFLDRFLGLTDVRTMMAHGSLSALPGWGITFEYINRAPGGLIEKRSRRFSEEHLAQIAADVNRLSRLGQGLYWRGGLNLALPEAQWDSGAAQRGQAA